MWIELRVTVAKSSYTRIYWFALDASSPATAMVTAGNLEILRGNLHIVQAILYELHTALSGVILHPGVRIKLVSLITCMAGL